MTAKIIEILLFISPSICRLENLYVFAKISYIGYTWLLTLLCCLRIGPHC